MSVKLASSPHEYRSLISKLKLAITKNFNPELIEYLEYIIKNMQSHLHILENAAAMRDAEKIMMLNKAYFDGLQAILIAKRSINPKSRTIDEMQIIKTVRGKIELGKIKEEEKEDHKDEYKIEAARATKARENIKNKLIKNLQAEAEAEVEMEAARAEKERKAKATAKAMVETEEENKEEGLALLKKEVETEKQEEEKVRVNVEMETETEVKTEVKVVEVQENTEEKVEKRENLEKAIEEKMAKTEGLYQSCVGLYQRLCKL